MAASIVQFALSDPAPNNIGNVGGAGGVQHLRVASLSGFTAGNTLICLGAISTFTGNTVTSIADSVGNTWTPREHRNGVIDVGPGQFLDGLLSYAPNISTIAPGFCGLVSASSTTTATCTKLDGTSPGWTTNQWTGASFQEYATGSPISVASNTANTITFSSAITAPGVGNPMSVGGYVRVNYNAFDDYTGGLVVEVTGVGPTPLLGSSSVGANYSAGATFTSGPVSCGTGTGILIGFAYLGQTVGAGFVDDGAFGAFNYGVGPIAYNVEHKIISNAGNAPTTFVTEAATYYAAFGIALSDVGGPGGDTLMGAICL